MIPIRSLARYGIVAVLAVVAALVVSCGDDDDPPNRPPTGNTRTYFMGFSSFPPRPTIPDILQTIDAFESRADYGMILAEPPWDSLLAGRPPDSLILANQVGLAAYMRSKGLRILISIDPTNGLDRSSDAAALVAAGRSLTEDNIQHLYVEYVAAMDSLIRPDYLGVASETNLIRKIAPPSLYQAVIAAATGAMNRVRSNDLTVKIFTTVQVETAWGKLGGTTEPYAGIDTDRADFPFIQVLGLSSYPYLGGFVHPDSIPLNYYSTLVANDPIPTMVIEGGWSSDSLARWIPWANPPILNSETQKRYITRHAAILDQAASIGWFQITYTDLDYVALGLPVGAAPFLKLGLVDVDYNPKPARDAWDAEFARPR